MNPLNLNYEQPTMMNCSKKLLRRVKMSWNQIKFWSG